MLLNRLTSLYNNVGRSSTQTLSAGVHYISRDPTDERRDPAPNFLRVKKHKNPKYRAERGRKIMKVNFPDFNKKEKEMYELTPEDIRAKYKERGIQPPRRWDSERPIYISATSGVFEAYVPPEGDGKLSIASKAGAKQKLAHIAFKGKALNELRKIRQYEDDFEPKMWVDEAHKIYLESHQALVDDDEDRLHQVVTEFAYPKVVNAAEGKQIRWSFVKTLEHPRVVHIRTTDVITKDNIFAQLTVRFHTSQTLAVYDRFGRLMHGSEVLARDVLEYVVFEKHISNTYGVWRVHDKIIPAWMPPRQSALRTYRIDEEEVNEEESKATEVATTDSESKAVAS